MLKRIVVMSNNEDLARQAAALAEKQEDVQTVVQSTASGLPPGTVAIVADEENLPGAMDQAIALGNANEQAMFLLADALDCRESLDPGSSRRVMECAVRFARTLNLDDNDTLTLARGVLLRDIGKTQIANDVLLKDGLLNYDEWSLIHEHPHIGAEILSQTDSLKDTAEIVRHHHECYDGTGYPDGLEGDAIPRMARIAKIVDVYCAMTSPRVYRKGQSTQEEGINFVLSERGKHFDPELVDVFISANIAPEGA